MGIGSHQIRLALAPPLSGPYRPTAHASPHSPARALARGAYQLNAPKESPTPGWATPGCRGSNRKEGR